MKVRATQRGFDGLTVREPGDVFPITNDQFAESWMEIVPDDTPENVTPAQEALNREIDARLRGRQ